MEEDTAKTEMIKIILYSSFIATMSRRKRKTKFHDVIFIQ